MEPRNTVPDPAASSAPGARAADAHPIAPPPWALRLEGVVLFLRARPGTAGARGGLLGGFSAVAFVDYSESGVGPYRELLYAEPIRRRTDGTGPSVRGIWVTSEASAVSGNHNWGLTKSVAAIDRAPSGDGEQWTAADGGGDLGALVHRPFGPALPVAKPRGLGRLLQTRYGNAYATPVSLACLVRPTRVEAASFDAARVVDLDQHRIIGAVAVTHGRMGFHAAGITPLR